MQRVICWQLARELSNNQTVNTNIVKCRPVVSSNSAVEMTSVFMLFFISVKWGNCEW